MGMKKLSDLDQTKRLMGALVRMKPKPHEEMKVGKKKPAKASAKKRASSTIPHAVLPARLLGDRTYFQPDPIRIIGISSLPDTLMFSCCVVASSSVDGRLKDARQPHITPLCDYNRPALAGAPRRMARTPAKTDAGRTS